MVESIRGHVSDTEKRALRADLTTHTLQTIAYAHHEIHSGSMFRVQAYNDAIGDDATLAIVFRVANQTKHPHFLFQWETEDVGNISLLEDVTVTVGSGTDVSVKNSRRDSNRISIMKGCASGSWVSGYITKDATISGGNIVSHIRVYSNNRAGGGEGGRDYEIILNVNTDYALVFTNTAGSAKGAQLRCEWYEHTDRD